MTQAAKGNKVKVHYTGKLADGNVFDSSREREPIEFTVGAGQMIEGFDKAVEGMKVGDKQEVTIPSDKAYGPRVEEAIIAVPKEKLPQDMEPQVGMSVEAHSPEGQKQILVIVEVKDTEVVLDGNHPLAGKDLIFEIELMEVN